MGTSRNRVADTSARFEAPPHHGTRIIAAVKILGVLLLSGMLFLIGCQGPVVSTVTIIDGGRTQILTTGSGTDAASLLQRGSENLTPGDRLLVDGLPVPAGAQLPNAAVLTLQVQRAISVRINGNAIQTTAPTVGEALADAGFPLYSVDKLDPPAQTPLADGMSVIYVPSKIFNITVDGRQLPVRSSAETVGAVLAQAGLPLVGLDFSQPGGGQGVPSDGSIRVTRVAEALLLTQRTLPYQSSFEDSADVALGEEKILQPGLTGLATTRTRVRYEDGVEVSRQPEPEVIVRPPQNRIVARGSKIVEQSTTVGGISFQYWRVLQMYATTYSPCESGSCDYGTKSGLRAGKGVVAVDPALYDYLNGQRLYIPGYGYAVVGDIGGGYIVEQKLGISRYKWIDLGFDDNNMPDLTGWITVYFLPPAPATIPDALK